jgi:hypothetical protein
VSPILQKLYFQRIFPFKSHNYHTPPPPLRLATYFIETLISQGPFLDLSVEAKNHHSDARLTVNTHDSTSTHLNTSPRQPM